VCAYWWMWVVCMCHDTLFALSRVRLCILCILCISCADQGQGSKDLRCCVGGYRVASTSSARGCDKAALSSEIHTAVRLVPGDLHQAANIFLLFLLLLSVAFSKVFTQTGALRKAH
jgi:hypothetical protein